MINKIQNIPGFVGYSVDTKGNVYSIRSINGRGGLVKTERKLKGGLTNGYPTVSLSQNGKIFKRSIHRLVLETFIGHCPSGMQACHNDGNPENNKLDNLRWDTPKGNNQDKYKHGTAMVGKKNPNYGKPLSKETKIKLSNSHKGKKLSDKTKTKMLIQKQGEKSHFAKLTEKQVRIIYYLSWNSTMLQREIGNIFKIHKNTVSTIKTKRNWTHIL